MRNETYTAEFMGKETACMYIVARGAATVQRPRDKANIPEWFLGNGSVNTFPQQQTLTQQWYSNRGTVFSVIRYVAVATQQRGKHLCGNESRHNRRAVFSMGFMPRCYNREV
jgi:hypothetical protein